MSEQFDYKAIGPRLRELRIQRGKTLAEMAEETGIGATALGNYENGVRIPRDETKVVLANYFQMTVRDLFFSP